MIILQEMILLKHLNDWSLEFFAPTICTGQDKQRIFLKYETINPLIGFFDVDTFNRAEVLKKYDQHINIVKDQYRVNLEMNPRYECLLMIHVREWKALLDDGRERDLRK
jgi:hypothetical protein